jgi:predicted phage-related endonuclease
MTADRDPMQIGSSDTPVILGFFKDSDPPQTPVSLCLQKRGEIPARETNLLMECGTHMESFIRAKWLERHGLHETDYQKPEWKFTHPEIPWMVSHVDCLNEARTHLVEFKDSRSGGPWRKGGNGLSIPDYVTAQVQHSAAVIPTVTEITVVAIAGSEWFEESFEPDKALQGWIIDEDTKFHEALVSGGLPEPCNQAELRMARGFDPEAAVVADDELMGLLLKLDDYRRIHLDAKPAEEQIKNLKWEIAQRMGGAKMILDEHNSPIYQRSLRKAHVRPECQVAESEQATFTKWWKP